MKHIMHLNDSPFDRMKSGNKKREYRVNDEKRKLVRVGDVIEFHRMSDDEDILLMDVVNIEVYSSLEEAIEKHFDEDFKERHEDILSAVNTFLDKSYMSDEEINENGVVVIEVKKHRISHLNATACYLKKDDEVLMIKFKKKWGCVYAPPGGKFESGETPTDCIIREFYEETGLTLVNPKLQGISYWKDSYEGMIFIYVAEEAKGELTIDTDEGNLEWVKLSELDNINQFDQNKKFTPYLFKDKMFEGKFLLDDTCKVLDFSIRNI